MGLPIPRSLRPTLYLALIGATAFALASGCQNAPPTSAEQANICDIFDDRRNWYREARASERKWDAPIALQMAILQAESSFDADARPARNRVFFGLLPGRRPSSAYGYAQAVDGTWDTYRRDTGNNGAERDDFDDAIDFVGWYIRQTARRTGVSPSNARGQYLAYHQGWAGYNRGNWRGNSWLIGRADQVATTTARYDRQLRTCERRLRRDWNPFF